MACLLQATADSAMRQMMVCAMPTMLDLESRNGGGEWEVEQMDPEQIQRRITAGQRSLRRLRLVVSGSSTLLSVLFSSLYIACLSATGGFVGSVYYCGNSFQLQFVTALACIGDNARFLLWNLAPLADDLFFTRLVLFGDAITYCVGLHEQIKVWEHLTAFPRRSRAVVVALFRSTYIVVTVMFLYIMSNKDVGRMQAQMWKLILVTFIADLLFNAFTAASLYFSCNALLPLWWRVVTEAAALYFVCHPKWRQSFQKRLMHLYSRHYSCQAAASIAGLVGNCPASEALAQASKRFHCVHLVDLTFDDMKDNTPKPELFELAFHAQLLECEAFISHSWHDDPMAKWTALQDWRSRFIEQHSGREPALWIDKCCIDQRDIAADLRCLPIYLSGCRKLVVLIGETYLSRLWCIIELFSFVHMGRSLDCIEFIPVGCSPTSQSPLNNSVACFDANQCECFDPKDKDKMLQIICAAFGDVDNFNNIVKQTLRRAAADSRSGSESTSSSLAHLFPGEDSSSE